MRMKPSMIVLCVAAAIGLASAAAQAAVTIDFDAVALRRAGLDGSGDFATVAEDANGNGMTTSALVAGQKVYYGTNFFDGGSLGTLQSMQFTYSGGPMNNVPYLNVQVMNGSSYGVIALAVSTSFITDNHDGSFTASYSFARDVVGYYEFVLNGATKPTSWQDAIDDGWTLLSGNRTLSPGEQATTLGDPHAKGPIYDSLAIIWGDSAANYTGARHIYDVTVTGSDGTVYQAAVPEPCTLAIWSLFGGIGVAGGWLRRRKTA
jgi:hypothetical protein